MILNLDAKSSPCLGVATKHWRTIEGCRVAGCKIERRLDDLGTEQKIISQVSEVRLTAQSAWVNLCDFE